MRLKIVLSLMALAPSYLYAAPNCKFNSWPALAAEALQAAPEWASLVKKQELDRTAIEAAALSPLARAEAQILGGQDSEAELRYEWTIERSGKKDRRQRAAQSQLDLSLLAVEGGRALLLRDLAVMVDRFQQIDHEKEILDETVSTYRALIRQYGERAALSPEQDVTLAVFKLARDETLLKIGQLQVEIEGYRSQLGHLTGCVTPQLPMARLKERSVWPEFATRLEAAALFRKQNEARQVQAKAVLEQDQAASQADLSIGPLARWSRSDGDNRLAFGIAASLPIGQAQPRVTGQVAQAAYDLALAENSYEEKKRAADYDRWLQQYRKAVDVLKQGFAETDVRVKHERMEQAFLAGRVSAPLIIEAHRQMYEHQVSRHQIEMKAMEAYWNLRYLTGRLRSEDL